MSDLRRLIANLREQSARKVRPDAFSRTYFARSTATSPQLTCLNSLTYLSSQNQETS